MKKIGFRFDEIVHKNQNSERFKNLRGNIWQAFAATDTGSTNRGKREDSFELHVAENGKIGIPGQPPDLERGNSAETSNFYSGYGKTTAE
jgi:hypothetical protein